jgi:hypothetical protein
MIGDGLLVVNVYPDGKVNNITPPAGIPCYALNLK